MKHRLHYIDALRTLAILFIIFGHLPMYSYGESYCELISIRSFTSMIQIALFFFISGFLYSVKWIQYIDNQEYAHVGGVFFKFREKVVGSNVGVGYNILCLAGYSSDTSC